MLTPEKLVEAFMSAKGDQTVKDVLENADIVPTSITRINRGHEPSLTRANELADAVGLEVVLRPKGEVISPEALTLAVLAVLVNTGSGTPEDARKITPHILEGYKGFEEVLSMAPPSQRQAVFKAAWLGLSGTSKADKSEDLDEYEERVFQDVLRALEQGED